MPVAAQAETASGSGCSSVAISLSCVSPQGTNSDQTSVSISLGPSLASGSASNASSSTATRTSRTRAASGDSEWYAGRGGGGGQQAVRGARPLPEREHIYENFRPMRTVQNVQPATLREQQQAREQSPLVRWSGCWFGRGASTSTTSASVGRCYVPEHQQSQSPAATAHDANTAPKLSAARSSAFTYLCPSVEPVLGAASGGAALGERSRFYSGFTHYLTPVHSTSVTPSPSPTPPKPSPSPNGQDTAAEVGACAPAADSGTQTPKRSQHSSSSSSKQRTSTGGSGGRNRCKEHSGATATTSLPTPSASAHDSSPCRFCSNNRRVEAAVTVRVCPASPRLPQSHTRSSAEHRRGGGHAAVDREGSSGAPEPEMERDGSLSRESSAQQLHASASTATDISSVAPELQADGSVGVPSDTRSAADAAQFASGRTSSLDDTLLSHIDSTSDSSEALRYAGRRSRSVHVPLQHM